MKELDPMSAKGAVNALLDAVRNKDLAALAAATKGGKIDVVPLDRRASSSKAKEYFEALAPASRPRVCRGQPGQSAGDNALLGRGADRHSEGAVPGHRDPGRAGR